MLIHNQRGETEMTGLKKTLEHHPFWGIDFPILGGGRSPRFGRKSERASFKIFNILIDITLYVPGFP